MALIRVGRPDDIESMVGLLRQLFEIEADFTFDSVRHKRGLALLLASDTAVVYVAEEDGRIVGMATGQLLISTAEGARSLLVEDVVVEKSYRSRGIGRELIGSVASWGSEREASRMQLLADTCNEPALSFYQGSGWSRTNLICLRKYTTRTTDEPNSNN